MGLAGRGAGGVKIVVLDGLAANPGDLSWDGLAALGELTVYDDTPRPQIAQRLQGAQAAISNRMVMDGAVFAACPDLRYLGLLATGYNLVDLDAARAHGVTVCNVPAYSTESVAQTVFALLLELTNHAARYDGAVRAGRWVDAPALCVGDAPIMELSGKTMGLVGYGNTGSAVARLALAFGMRVVVNTPHPDRAVPVPGVTFQGLDEVLARADVLSLHCPLFDSTRRLICAETIAKMKDGAILINTSRGPVVDEDDLAAALRSGKLRGAGLDVLCREPPEGDCPLAGLPNCVITPHVAWASREARSRLLAETAENLRAFQEGRPRNVVS